MALRGEFYDGKQPPYLTPAPLGEGGGEFAAPTAVKNSHAAQPKGMLGKRKLHPTTYLLDSAQSLPCVCVCVTVRAEHCSVLEWGAALRCVDACSFSFCSSLEFLRLLDSFGWESRCPVFAGG